MVADSCASYLRVKGIRSELAARGFPIACADGHGLPLADSSADFLSAFDVIERLDDDRSLGEFPRFCNALLYIETA
jgi:hypothetical protein